jgi:hypothetical protein
MDKYTPDTMTGLTGDFGFWRNSRIFNTCSTSKRPKEPGEMSKRKAKQKDAAGAKKSEISRMTRLVGLTVDEMK